MVVDNPPGESMSPAANSWRLSSVERASMTEQVLRELRDAIVEGRIPQGEPLREVSLATTLGTGRSAIREAIRQLVQEGLVEYEPHRGAFVRVMSLADRLDVYAAREAIESGAVRRIVAGPPVDLSALRAALAELRDTARFHDRVTDAVIAADIRFHEELVRLAGSPRLERAHATLVAETRMLLRHHPLYPWATYISDHARVVEALERRDGDAPELIAEHLRLSARLIAGELEHEAAGEAARPRDDEPVQRGEGNDVRRHPAGRPPTRARARRKGAGGVS
jgi:DNA-binding GntR family transcriptional regulator